MDFPAKVRTMVVDDDNKKACLDWWQSLKNEARKLLSPSDPAAPNPRALLSNIQRGALIERNPDLRKEISSFARAIASGPKSDGPVKDAANAIEESEAMICAGPQAADLGSEACTLVSFEVFLEWWSVYPRADPETKKRMWDDLAKLDTYPGWVDPMGEARSCLPHRFWTGISELTKLGALHSVPTSRLCDYLGLRWSDRGLLIGILPGKEPSFAVPTGWDGFDNQFFRENDSYDAGDPSTNCGYTIDQSTFSPGAREVVSRPVRLSDTELLKRCE